MKMKHLKLLKYLSGEGNWVNASALSAKMNVSLRSVKNYVSEINLIEPGLIESSRQGYRVDVRRTYRLFKEARSGLPQTPEERVHYLINHLVNGTGETGEEGLNIYDLGEEICVSDATVRADIQKVRQKCARFDLTLKTGGDYLRLIGTEKNKRRALSSIMFDESRENFMNIGSIQAAFQNYDVLYIRDVIAGVLNEHHYFINDYSMMNLVLYVAVAVDRISNGYLYAPSGKEDAGFSGPSCERRMSEEIAGRLGEKFQIAYNESEVSDLALLLGSSTTRLEYQTANTQALRTAIGDGSLELTRELLEGMKEFYGLEMTDPAGLTRFALHMNGLLLRAKNNQYLHNPLAGSIKSSCPLIYDCAVSVSEHFKKLTGFAIPDDEIAYIALHIGSAAVREKSLAEKVSCILLFPQYYDLNRRLADRLAREFGDRLFVCDVVTDAARLSEKRADLILSTIAVETCAQAPVLCISPFLTDRDREALGKKLSELEKKKKAGEFREKLRAVLRPEFFEKNVKLQDREQVLRHIYEKLLSLGFVRDTFLDEVFERERLSSTAFNNIAIPHSTKMNSIRTCLYVTVSEKGIRWGEGTVNIVLLLAVNPDERALFREIFDALTFVLTDETRIRRVIQARTWEEFVELVAQ